MSELCRRQIIRLQQIMKKSALTVLIALLPLAAIAQTPSINEDGKKIEKEKMETKDYLPEVHGTIRAKYEYQTTMGAGRFEVRNARVSVTGNVLPSVAYKAEIDLSDEGQIKMHDSRVTIYNEDGLRFIRSKTDAYDLIIIDSPNPFGPGEGLFTKEFYGNCYNALHDDGIMINQNESPFYEEEAFQCQRMHKRILETFPICRVYQAHIPSYPSGHWLFGFASKKYHPLNDLNGVAWKLKEISTRYYEPRLHAGVFALPVYVEELLKDVE